MRHFNPKTGKEEGVNSILHCFQPNETGNTERSPSFLSTQWKLHLEEGRAVGSRDACCAKWKPNPKDF